MFSALSSLHQGTQIHASSTAFAALIWWAVPVIAVTIAIGYVIWTTKFKEKFGMKIPYWKDSLEECIKRLNIEVAK